jgi:hypothetical protein
VQASAKKIGYLGNAPALSNIFTAECAKIAKKKSSPQISQMSADQECKPPIRQAQGRLRTRRITKKQLSTQHSAKTKAPQESSAFGFEIEDLRYERSFI